MVCRHTVPGAIGVEKAPTLRRGVLSGRPDWEALFVEFRCA